MAKKRIDDILVIKGLAADQREAQALVMAGKVIAGDQRIDKPGHLVATDIPVRVKQSGRFVSRGGEKLQGVLEEIDLEVTDKIALDVGASTGGFTDCLLKAGAKHIAAIDVGTNQLAYELRTDPRVSVFEQCDIRTYENDDLPLADIVVADISFNSLARLADAFWNLKTKPHAHYILLVKPQFELPPELVEDGGVVTDPNLHLQAIDAVKTAFAALGASSFQTHASKLPGRTGNQEYFLIFTKST